MTKDDFLAWKQQEVTQAVFQALAQRRLEMISSVVYSSDPDQDRENKGRIKELDAMIGLEFEDAA